MADTFTLRIPVDPDASDEDALRTAPSLWLEACVSAGARVTEPPTFTVLTDRFTAAREVWCYAPAERTTG